MRAKLLWCAVAVVVLCGCSCRRSSRERLDVVEPSLSTPQTTTREVSFYSASLQRRMRYRILLPASYTGDLARQYPLLVLLHGRNYGIGERDWHMHSNLVPSLAGAELVVVLPQGDDSYYTNAARKAKDRYEDYIVKDLIQDVESNYRISKFRELRGIGGVSMGGWGALNLGMRHPEMFSFVAALSGPLDITERGFTWRRFWNSIYLRSIFGANGSDQRKRASLYGLLVWQAPSLHKTRFFLSCGTKESLLEPNRRMARAMAELGLDFEYKEVPEPHGWTNWNQLLPEVIRNANKQFKQ